MNLTLIGMSGVGKSVIGEALADALGYAFIDIDELIESRYDVKLQEFIDKFGEEKFLEIEERMVLSIGTLDNCIISTGGSVIYLEQAMEFLKGASKVVFLNDSLENIQEHISNRDDRGIVGLKNKSFETLFKERLILYQRYADLTVSLPDKFEVSMVVEDIRKDLGFL